VDPVETITSPANPRVKQAARLRDAGERRATGLTLVDGIRELSRAIASGIDVVEVFVAADSPRDASPRAADRDACLSAFSAGGGEVLSLGPRAFAKVAFGDRNEGVVAVVRFSPRSLAEVSFDTGGPVLVAEGVEKPGNLGAILRTADAAGLAGVIACEPRTDVANPAAIRASLGTVFRVPLAVASTAETISWAGTTRRRVVVATPVGSRPWHDVALCGDTLLVVGSEADGVSRTWREAADAGRIAMDTVHLPMLGVADSLNVSVTAAVLAYEALRQNSGSR
jgi:TrmH family RNA methyltransferase